MTFAPPLAALTLGPAGWWGIALAVTLGAGAFWLYRRQLHDAGALRQVILPTLRSLAIVAIALMIGQPSLSHSRTFTQRGQVIVLADGSGSMGVADPQANSAHKLLAARSFALTDTSDIDFSLAEIADRLRRARLEAQAALERGGAMPEDQQPLDAASPLAREATDVADALWRLPPELFGAGEVRGSALMESWNNVPGRRLTEAERQSVVTRPADARESVSSLRLPANVGENFLRRIRGRLHPPESGSYVFHLAVDTSAELLLSSDENAAALRTILHVPLRTDPDDFSNRSEAVPLEAGRAYFFELRHKEGEHDDHLTLAWSRNGADPAVIETANLSSPGGLLNPESRRAEIARGFAEQVSEPAARLRDLAGQPRKPATREVLAAMLEAETQLRGLFEAFAADLTARGHPQAVAAGAAFDSLPRSQRMQQLVSQQAPGAFTYAVSQAADVEIRTASGSAVADSAALGAATDLAAALDGVEPSEDRPQAVVLLSDGRHNTGPSPAEVAATLGRRAVPVHSVLIGSAQPPPDIAVLEVVGPAAVHREDQVSGRIVLLDAMPPGKAFTLRITGGEQTLWEEELETIGRGRREIEFSFKADEAVPQTARASLSPTGAVEAVHDERGAKLNELLLPLRVESSLVAGELQDQNNLGDLPVRVTLSTGRMLLIDGRPRWDVRYIASLLGRDKRWEVHEVTGPDKDGQTLARGEGGIPQSREGLFEYDVVVLGEVPVDWWRGEELQWLADFVDKRGGGLVVIDGSRQMLRDYSGTPLEKVLPAVRETAPPLRVENFDLTAAGHGRDALRLEPQSARNAELWRALPPPRWIMPISPLPGSEVLLEAVMADGQRAPAIVAARVGRGQVWYQAFDETWRWRKDAENRWQSRYWSGMANRIMEPPFAVEDKFVALGVEQAAVELGGKIDVRARLRDEEGDPVTSDAARTITASAVLLHEGAPVAEVRLTPDASGGGLFRAQIPAPREAGAYEVAVTTDRYPATALSARAGVVVKRPAASGELARLDADEELMRQLAEVSGGRFLHEHQAQELPELLSGLSRSRTVTSEYDIWTSWPLFSFAIALLGIEWLIRRRTGML